MQTRNINEIFDKFLIDPEYAAKYLRAAQELGTEDYEYALQEIERVNGSLDIINQNQVLEIEAKTKISVDQPITK